MMVRISALLLLLLYYIHLIKPSLRFSFICVFFVPKGNLLDLYFLIDISNVSLKTCLILLLLNTTCPVLANSVDPDQLASEEATDLDLHCLLVYMRISIKNLDRVI